MSKIQDTASSPLQMLAELIWSDITQHQDHFIPKADLKQILHRCYGEIQCIHGDLSSPLTLSDSMKYLSLSSQPIEQVEAYAGLLEPINISSRVANSNTLSQSCNQILNLINQPMATDYPVPLGLLSPISMNAPSLTPPHRPSTPFPSVPLAQWSQYLPQNVPITCSYCNLDECAAPLDYQFFGSNGPMGHFHPERRITLRAAAKAQSAKAQKVQKVQKKRAKERGNRTPKRNEYV